MTEIKKDVKASVESNKVERPRERKRGVFNGTQSKLQVGQQIEGYHLHIFNDTPGRIQAAIENGYEFVSPEEVGYASTNVTNRNVDLGGRVSVVGSKNDMGQPVQQVLLKIKQEWWDEDQEELATKNRKIEQAIRGGKLTGEGQSTEGFYNAGIKADVSNKF